MDIPIGKGGPPNLFLQKQNKQIITQVFSSNRAAADTSTYYERIIDHLAT